VNGVLATGDRFSIAREPQRHQIEAGFRIVLMVEKELPVFRPTEGTLEVVRFDEEIL
jgi:hypothetical protein